MLHTPPQTPFVLASTVVITPLDAAVGSGLMKTRDNTFVTQCETTGFARISYHMDRPDVLSRYSSVLLRADAAATPVLLSNGNLVAAGQLRAGRHYTLWTVRLHSTAGQGGSSALCLLHCLRGVWEQAAHCCCCCGRPRHGMRCAALRRHRARQGLPVH
jgi:hypothetical protein